MNAFLPVAMVGVALGLALSPLHADGVFFLDGAGGAINHVSLDGTISLFKQVNQDVNDFSISGNGSLYLQTQPYNQFGKKGYEIDWYTPDGSYGGQIAESGTSGAAGFGIVSDRFGNLVFRTLEASFNSTIAVRRWDAVTHQLTPFSSELYDHSESYDLDSAMDGFGNYYITILGGGIWETTPGNVSHTVFSFQNGFARHLTADLTGNLYADIALPNGAGRGLYKVAPDGSISLVADGVFGYLATDADGNIFVNQAGTLLEVTPGGAVTPIASGLPANGQIATIVPEPGSALLLGTGMALMLTQTRRRRNG